MKLNVGSGAHPLPYWCNLDGGADALVNVRAMVPPIPYLTGSLDEIFAGHFLEHLTRPQAHTFLDECHRCLKPGGRLGIVVPDFREVVRRYLNSSLSARMEFPRGHWNDLHDLDTLCDTIIFSTVQDSHHQWAYDRDTLPRMIARHGFTITGDINPWFDPRVAVGAWYQFGINAVKEG